MTRHMNTGGLRALTIVVLVSATFVLGACSGDETSAPTETTLPSGFPDPPLPGDMIPADFFLNELAAMGNMKLIVSGVAVTPEDTIEITLGVENGALEPVVLSRSSFRVYATDGRSFVPVDGTATDLFGVPLQSGELRRDTVVFPFEPGLSPAALLLDGALYGDRVSSVLIILDDRAEPTGAEVIDP
jgi:hypothetical protein